MSLLEAGDRAAVPSERLVDRWVSALGHPQEGGNDPGIELMAGVGHQFGDCQFYPGVRGWLTKLDRRPDGGYALDPEFLVDFADQADGARPHEIHLWSRRCSPPARRSCGLRACRYSRLRRLRVCGQLRSGAAGDY